MSRARRKISASGLWKVNEAGGNIETHERVPSLEMLESMSVQFAPLVADHGDFQPISTLEGERPVSIISGKVLTART